MNNSVNSKERVAEVAITIPVNSEADRVENHDAAVHGFLISDAIAWGIEKDWQVVVAIPSQIAELIENKGWEKFYVDKGVVTPFYCGYTKGSDRENFSAFITADRPYGLGTTVETLERVLELDQEVLVRFYQVLEIPALILEPDDLRGTAQQLREHFQGDRLKELMAYLQGVDCEGCDGCF